ncbi:carbohydrate ABC transporter permease [Streptomyces griseorubiginosus]|uniref:carbohydrate ABC transporter permease n=1 Tax=Streptomyces griseorubiginosus TaxID=67304 RepID=UPI00099EFD62|nr:sugar ABC transporter permease [Streptomyces griseorubiginosus]
MTMKIQPMVDNEAADPSRKAGRQRLRADRGSRRGLHRHWWPFAIPAVALTWLFFLIPFVLNIRFAFTQWTGFSDVISWNGLKNFRGLIDQGILWKSIEVTLVYAGIAMVIQNVFSLGMAVLLQRTNRINSFFRSVFFLPVLLSPLAAGYIWSAILSPTGPLNNAIGLVLGNFDYAWLGHPFAALASVAFIDAWKWSGLVTLVYIAGLNAIPDSLSEAAVIDGANAWQRFWRIKFRLLAPAFTFSVVLTFIGALGAFDIVQATTQGGPGNATTVLNIAMFSQYAGGFFGTASSLSLVVTILVIALGVPLIAFLRRREVEA